MTIGMISASDSDKVVILAFLMRVLMTDFRIVIRIGCLRVSLGCSYACLYEFYDCLYGCVLVAFLISI